MRCHRVLGSIGGGQARADSGPRLTVLHHGSLRRPSIGSKAIHRSYCARADWRISPSGAGRAGPGRVVSRTSAHRAATWLQAHPAKTDRRRTPNLMAPAIAAARSLDGPSQTHPTPSVRCSTGWATAPSRSLAPTPMGLPKVRRRNGPYVRAGWANIGASVIGPQLFARSGGWDGRPAIGSVRCSQYPTWLTGPTDAFTLVPDGLPSGIASGAQAPTSCR